MADNLLHEPEMFRDRVKKIAEQELSRHISDPASVEANADYIAIKVCELVNEHSKAQKILSADDRSHIGRLKKRMDYLDASIKKRDPLETAALKEKFGSDYQDFAAAELSAIRWAVEFIQEHSL